MSFKILFKLNWRWRQTWPAIVTNYLLQKVERSCSPCTAAGLTFAFWSCNDLSWSNSTMHQKTLHCAQLLSCQLSDINWLRERVWQASELLQTDWWELGMREHKCNTSSFEHCCICNTTPFEHFWIVSSQVVSSVLMQISVQEGRPWCSFIVLCSLITPSSVRLNYESVFSVK